MEEVDRSSPGERSVVLSSLNSGFMNINLQICPNVGLRGRAEPSLRTGEGSRTAEVFLPPSCSLETPRPDVAGTLGFLTAWESSREVILAEKE